MRKTILKLHIYAGLLAFAQLVVYAVAGLTATLQPSLERSKTPRSVRTVPFPIAANASDRQIAAEVYRTLHFPLSRPVPDWFLQRTPDGNMLLDFYNMNGIRRVTVLEREQQLRIEEVRNNAWLFLEDVHAATPADEDAPALVRAWAVWNEFSMWCLLGFCLSGVYLWLTSQPRFGWAWVSGAAGALLFAILYFAIR